jgi:hypothetical protein
MTSRLTLIVLAYVVASAAATIALFVPVLVPIITRGAFNSDLLGAFAGSLPITLFFVMVIALLPASLLIAYAERYAQRSPGYFATAGALSALIPAGVFALIVLSGRGLAAGLVVGGRMVVAGIIAGVVYWAVAGRSAGQP